MRNNVLYKYGPAVLGIGNLALANGNLWMVITGLVLIIIALMGFFDYDNR